MKRFFLIVLLFFFLTLSLPHPAFAAWFMGEGASQAYTEAGAGGSNAEAFTAFQIAGGGIPCGLLLAMSGAPCDDPTAIVTDPFFRQMAERSVLGGVSRGIAMIYQSPPADFGVWLADVGHTLGFMPQPVYAQGIGFSGLTALLPVWKAFRNIAYLILAVVMIVIGFMVMLRKKIDPKTVVTVQNALPRIIVTLILITFSYAIVGFLIDLMYLLILLLVSTIGTSIQGINISEQQAAFTAGGFGEVLRIFDPLGTLVAPAAVGVAGYGIPALIAAILGVSTFGGPPGIILGVIVAMIAGGLAGNALGTGAAVGALSPILLLLLFLSLIVIFVRIFFILLNAYIQIIISLIFGPLQIMLEAIPGVNSFGSWLNNLIVNLLTFPIVIALIMLGASISTNISSAYFWTPPLVPKAPDTSQFIAALIGFGIIMSIPSIVNAVKEALKIKPAVPVGAGVLTQPIVGAGMGVLQIGSQAFYFGSTVKMAKEWLASRAQK